MKGLMIKDFLTLKKSIATMLLMNAFFLIFAYAGGDPSYAVSMTAIMFSMLTLTSMSYDQMTKWDRYALSTPVSRKEVVISKYLLAILLSTASVLLSFTASFFLILPKSDMSAQELMLVAYTVFAVSLVYISIVLPLIYKFGVERTRIISIGVLALPMVFILLLSKSGVQMPGEEQLLFALKCSPLPVLLIVGCSFFTSLKIYRNTEF